MWFIHTSQYIILTVAGARRKPRIADRGGTLPRGRHFLPRGRPNLSDERKILSQGANFCILGGIGAMIFLLRKPSVQ